MILVCSRLFSKISENVENKPFFKNHKKIVDNQKFQGSKFEITCASIWKNASKPYFLQKLIFAFYPKICEVIVNSFKAPPNISPLI